MSIRIYFYAAKGRAHRKMRGRTIPVRPGLVKDLTPVTVTAVMRSRAKSLYEPVRFYSPL
jgi:hypothetical protein